MGLSNDVEVIEVTVAGLKSRLWFEDGILQHVEDDVFEHIVKKRFADVIQYLDDKEISWTCPKALLLKKLEHAKKACKENKPRWNAARPERKKLSNAFAFNPVAVYVNEVEPIEDPAGCQPQDGHDLLRKRVALQYNVPPGAVKLSGRMPVEIYRQQQWHFVGYADEYVDMDSLLAAGAKTAKRANAYEPPLLVSEAFAYPDD